MELGANIEAAARDDSTPVCTAAGQGHLSLVKYLVEKGCLLDVTDKKGRATFDRAAVNDDDRVMRYLVEQGIDIHATETDGSNATPTAVRRGSLVVVRYLLEIGVDIDIKGWQGYNPFLSLHCVESWTL